MGWNGVPLIGRKMLKWMIPLLMINLLIPSIDGVTIQYSRDNLTWRNITNVDEVNYEGYQINLDADTLYYFRAKNGTSDWQYLSQRTEEGGLNQVEIALAIFAVLFIIVGLYLLFKRD